MFGKTRARIILFFLAPLIPASGFFKLHGFSNELPRPHFSMIDAINGAWQSAFEKDFSLHFGFYAPLVKLDSSLDYLVRETNLNSSQCTVIGKNGVLLAPDELNLHEREDFDWNKIDAGIDDLARAAEKLRGAGIRLVTIYVPDKVETYTDVIPERWMVHSAEPRPYVAVLATILQKMRAKGIPVLDSREILADVAVKTGLPSFPRGARHWSDMVSCAVLGKIQGFECAPERLADASPTEQDLLGCLNLFGPLQAAEQTLRPNTPVVSQHPTALFVGSSFSRVLESEARRLNLFDDLHLFYYNRTDYVSEDGHPIVIDDEWRRFVRSRRLIVIDFFAPQLETIGHGFPKQVADFLGD